MLSRPWFKPTKRPSNAAKLQLEYCSILFAASTVARARFGVTPGNLVKQNDVPILVVIAQVYTNLFGLFRAGAISGC